jgi:Cytochrome P460
MEEYHSYQPQTDKPEPVSAYIFGLCRLPTLKEQAFADSEHGDGRYLQDWANDLAVDGITRRGAPPFAPGAIIVKEKYVPGATAGQFELAALGFMIKREPGFAPAQQDWDFAYWEPELGVLSSAEQSTYCAGCHAGAAQTDSVFVDGLVP